MDLSRCCPSFFLPLHFLSTHCRHVCYCSSACQYYHKDLQMWSKKAVVLFSGQTLYIVNLNIFHSQFSVIWKHIYILLFNAMSVCLFCVNLAEDVIRERTGFHPLLSGAPKAGRHSSAMSYELQNHMVMCSPIICPINKS